MKARDIMTRSVVTITPATTVPEIARLLLEERIGGVPVVEGERVVGIVSEGDLLRRHEIGTDGHDPTAPWWMGFFERVTDAADYVKSHALRAADVMTRKVVSVTEEAPAAEMAELLGKRRIRRLPVLRDGRLVGIVTRANLVQALALRTMAQAASAATDDEAIRARLVEELDGHAWWRTATSVMVDRGVVHFWGVYDGEDAKQAARVAAENIPGVRAVEDHRMNSADLPMYG